MKTYELTVYDKNGKPKIIECRRMDAKEAWDFFRNHVNDDMDSCKMEIYE